MAYIGVDVGGTKTFVAHLSEDGTIEKQERLETSHDYPTFLTDLIAAIGKVHTDHTKGIVVALPAVIDHEHGVGQYFGNLPWENVPIKADLESRFPLPVTVENDAKLAGLSEAILIREDYRKVLYLTISTGIGGALIIDEEIAPALRTAEMGQMVLMFEGKYQTWESFASGHAIRARYGKEAHEITDENIWQEIASLLAPGIFNLTAVIKPEVIVVGGGMGGHFSRYREELQTELAKYKNPLVPVPPIQQAQRPAEAVIYGCYQLAKRIYAHAH